MDSAGTDAARLADAAVPASTAERGRRWTVVGLIVATGLGAALLWASDGVRQVERLTQALDSTQVGAEAVVAPPGTQAYTWHGVQVLVPSDWTMDDHRCGAPQSDTVLALQAICAAAVVEPPGLTVVEFFDLPAGLAGDGSYAGGWASVVTVATTVSGHPARCGAGSIPGAASRTVLVIPDVEVVVTLRSPDPAAAALLDTVRVVDVDEDGCPARLSSTRPVRPTAPGAAERLLPGDPESVVRCWFDALRVNGSARLTPTEVRELQVQLDALPVGAVPTSGGASYLRAADCELADLSGTILYVTYADGSQVQVVAHPNACTDDLRSVTNGMKVAASRLLPPATNAGGTG